MKCKICGAPHKACGPRTTVIPVDERIMRTEKTVAALKRYEIKTGRRGDITTTVQLSDADAKRLGSAAKLVDEKAAKPANKSRTAQNKGGAPRRPASKKAPAAPKTEEPPAGGEAGDDK